MLGHRQRGIICHDRETEFQAIVVGDSPVLGVRVGGGGYWQGV